MFETPNTRADWSTPPASAPRQHGAPSGAAPWTTAWPSACASSPLALLNTLLDSIEQAMWVGDAAGALQWANQAGRSELQRHQLLLLNDGALVCAQQERQSALVQALRAATHKAQRSMLPLTLNGQCVYLTVEPLSLAAGGPVLALLRLGRRQLCEALGLAMLARTHRLTGAEQRVLQALVQGHRPTQIAAAHRVGLATVRTQISTLRHKMNAASINDLLRLAAGLVAPQSALAGWQA